MIEKIKSEFNLKKSLFILLIVLAPLSKYPSFALPLFNFPSFRVGLYQILAGIFVVTCMVEIIKRRECKKDNKLITIPLLLILFSIFIGLFGAIDKSRYALLAGSIALLCLLLYTSYWYVKNFINQSDIKLIIKSMLFASIFYSVFIFVQFILSSFGNQPMTILCPNCSNDVFGFPRINFTAAEPQFLANSLIPFLFVAFFSYMKRYNWLAFWAIVSTSLAIGLTFSRGAYLAIAVSLLTVFIVILLAKKNLLKQFIYASLITLSSVILSLLLLVSAASFANKATPNIAYITTQTILEHLTLGVIQLPDRTIKVEIIEANDPSDDFQPPGLIEASTNERLDAASLAISAWSNNFKNIIFGVGAGNLGPYVVANLNPAAPANLTVYIFYVLFLSELGLISLISLGFIFGYIFYLLLKRLGKYPELLVILAIISAFFVQYLFFGSYINVVYIWLWLGISLGILSLTDTKLSKLLKTRV